MPVIQGEDLQITTCSHEALATLPYLTQKSSFFGDGVDLWKTVSWEARARIGLSPIWLVRVKAHSETQITSRKLKDINWCEPRITRF